MAGYSGDFDFRSDDEESATLNQRQRLPPEAVAPVAAAPAPPLPLPSPPGDGPRPMLYIKSDRLAELSRRMPVNQDRPALVHGLIEAYGLLEVRGRPPLQSACSRQLTQMHAARHRSQTSGLLLGTNEPCLHLSRISSLSAKLMRDLCHQSQPASPLTGTPVLVPPLPACRQGAEVVPAPPTSPSELLEFHSKEYLQALAGWERLPQRRRAEFGLEDDCAPFPG